MKQAGVLPARMASRPPRAKLSALGGAEGWRSQLSACVREWNAWDGQWQPDTWAMRLLFGFCFSGALPRRGCRRKELATGACFHAKQYPNRWFCRCVRPPAEPSPHGATVARPGQRWGVLDLCSLALHSGKKGIAARTRMSIRLEIVIKNWWHPPKSAARKE
jgi:hypothetical protein